MPNIKFTHNWNNKLDCFVFTTIRRSFPSKDAYYDAQIGNVFQVMVKGELHSYATLRTVYKGAFETIHEIIKALDTGVFDPEQYKWVFKGFGITDKTPVLLLVFQNVDHADIEAWEDEKRRAESE